MSEKRYSITLDNRIFDNYLQIFLSVSLNKHDAKVIVDLLNSLSEENEQLRQSYKYADELLEEIREVFEKNGVETGYNKRILETCFSALYENEQLRQKLKTICNTCCYDCEEKWCEK